MSYKSRLAEEKQKDAETRSQWTTSTRRELSAEDKLAQKIAKEVLAENTKLRGVHSGASIKQILEREAKRQIQMEAPRVATHNVQGEKGMDVNNLPYLHKNPAI